MSVVIVVVEVPRNVYDGRRKKGQQSKSDKERALTSKTKENANLPFLDPFGPSFVRLRVKRAYYHAVLLSCDNASTRTLNSC
eukprot:scaffold6803_cov60-Cylindrotheca_fusiformis.AAC.2